MPPERGLDSTPLRRPPPRGPHPPNIICQTQTLAAQEPMPQPAAAAHSQAASARVAHLSPGPSPGVH
jgi:hypothetical protein